MQLALDDTLQLILTQVLKYYQSLISQAANEKDDENKLFPPSLCNHLVSNMTNKSTPSTKEENLKVIGEELFNMEIKEEDCNLLPHMNEMITLENEDLKHFLLQPNVDETLKQFEVFIENYTKHCELLNQENTLLFMNETKLKRVAKFLSQTGIQWIFPNIDNQTNQIEENIEMKVSNNSKINLITNLKYLDPTINTYLNSNLEMQHLPIILAIMEYLFQNKKIFNFKK